MNGKKISRLAVILVVVMFGPMIARGDYVTAKFKNVSPGQGVLINLYSFSVWAGAYNWWYVDPQVPPPDDTFWTFCIEPTQALWGGATITFELKGLDEVLTAEKADYITELWTEKIIDGVVDPGDDSDDFNAAALQLAIWEFVVEDPDNGYDITDGDFYLSSGQDLLKQTVNNWIADTIDVGGGGTSLWALTNPSTQDQAVVGGSLQVVPLPAAVWGGIMLLGGMAAVASVRRRLLRK